MRPLPVLVSIAVCGAAVGCGAAAPPVASTPRTAATGSSPVVAHLSGRLFGDGDDDESESKSVGSTPRGDSDNDTDNDYKDNASNGYYDNDDSIISTYGHAPNAADERALTAVVKSYYAAAASEDGAAGCALQYSTYANSVVEDLGSGAGPPYLRGKTCAVVMTKMFAYLHARLIAPAEIVTVRVKGAEAYVLLGSTKRLARYFRLHREHGRWKILGTIDRPLP